jgi:AhpD family alkylhydroperoxidase
MEILSRISPAGARTYMEYRAAIMENPELAALSVKTKLLVGIGVCTSAWRSRVSSSSVKTKLLVGIGVAAALQSSRCTVMWTRQARAAGATDGEIVEAILTARLMKSATVNDAAAEALAWLAES